MDGVLEGAALLCVCKLVCSLLFLPSVVTSHSPVSFCSCCLLIFTDFLVSVFLSFLYIFEPWLPELTPLRDVIALRFLLFLSHTYGVVLFLTTPLIAVETLTRLLWPQSAVSHRTASQTATDPDARCCRAVQVEEDDGGDSPDKEEEEHSSPHAVGYLCCLSVWVVVALDVRWRWRLDEAWAVDCLHITNSLIRCLPNMSSPVSGTVSPCWIMVFLSILLLLLTTSTGLRRRRRACARMECAQRETHRVNHNNNNNNNNGHGCWKDLVPAPSAPCKPVNPGMSRVDPEKTESSCAVHSAFSRNSAQMSARHHGDFVLISPECLSAGQEQERTKTGAHLTFATDDDVDGSQCAQRQWGFPSPGGDVMIGLVAALSLFVLPLNLSVNIFLIRTVDSLLELCVKSVLSPTTNTRNTSSSRSETLA